MYKYFLSFLLVYFFVEVSLADNRKTKNEISRDYLIRKLENLYKTLDARDFAKKPITLRLSHMLSLRAEDRLSRQDDKTCKNCLYLGTKDARRSLSLYRKIGFSIKDKHPVLYSQSLFQMAYLHRLMGENSKFISYLKKIINLNVRDSFVVRAYFNLGEVYFESYKYYLSLKAFNEVLKRGDTAWAFRSYYRKIWSLYNLSYYDQSINVLEKFLKSYLYKEGVRTEVENSLKKKLQKELIVLYSRSQVTNKQVHFLYNFDKDEKQENTMEARGQRLFDLAKDLNRIGRVKPSNKVWNIYLNKDPSRLNQMKAYISMIDNYFVMHGKGWILESGQIVEKLFALQEKNGGCSGEICENLYKQQKRYMKELHRQSERNKKLKPYLFSLYGKYNAFYSNEFDMLVKYAFLSGELKKYGLSQDLFQKSVKVLQAKLKKSSKPKEIKNIKKDLEQVSVLQMEMAELSGDKGRRYQSYDFYLKHGTNEKIIYQTKYQQAYLVYEDKEYEHASKLFRSLALLKVKKSDKKIESLALKSAHLALSSLNFLNNKDTLMAEWSGLFQKRFPNNKEFIRINHTAIFNMVKNLLSGQDNSSYPLTPSSDKNVLKAWKVLNSVAVFYLGKKEKIKYYMNKLILAKELLKLKEMDEIISELMKIKLPKQDYKVVLTWKLWLAESRFNFAEALRLVKILKPKETSEQHYLRLAYLAELANEDYISYYETYIKKYPTSNKVFNIVKHIIDKSPERDKKTFLKKYVSYFEEKSDDLSYLVLELDRKELNIPFLKFFSSLPFMKDSLINKFLDRKFFIESFDKNYQKVQKFSLASFPSDRHLARSIRTYKGLIDGLEKEAEKSVKMKDWLSQVVAFSRVHNELVRFYESILKLPMPKGLTSEEKVKYTKLMESQMIPYKVRANKLKEEIDKLMAQGFIDKYMEVAKNEKVSHGFLRWEMDQLNSVITNKNQKSKIVNLLNLTKTSSQKRSPMVSQISDKVMKDIYANLKYKPFDKKYLNKFLKLERSKNNETMSYYLMNRIEKISKSKKGRVKL